MSTERLLAVALLIGSVLLLLQFGPGAIRSWQIYAGTGKRRQEDAHGAAPPAPPSVVDRAGALESLGYHRLGETRLALPTGVRFGWIVAAEDAESYAIIVPSPRAPGLTGVYSAWTDGTWLCTMHPYGEGVDQGTLHVRIVSTSLGEAVLAHRAGLEQFKRTHGEPRPIRTMPDMLALDADYRTRFGGSRLLPITMRIIMPALISAGIAVLSVILLVVSRP